MRYLSILFLPFLLISCLKNPISLEGKNFSGESHPDGPLRVISSKIKVETRYSIYINDILEKTDYEYYINGLLKVKIKSYPGNSFSLVNKYFYNDDLFLIKEIITEGTFSSDTIYFTYNSKKLLIKKETVHSTPTFILYDTVFYNYDLNCNLSELRRKDPHSQYSDNYAEKYEYSNNLLIFKKCYSNDNLLRTFEYKYYNSIKTEELVYFNNGFLEHRQIYYYQNRLLKHIKGFFAEEVECSDEVIYEYNNNHELIVKKVYVPIYSSYLDYEVHYEY